MSGFRDLSPPSNEIAYPSYGPTLGVQPSASGGAVGGVSLSFLANAGLTYYVQAAQDFQTWETLFTTNPPVTGPLAFEVAANPAYPKRFFRLAQQ